MRSQTLIVLISVLSLTACTSMQPVGGTPADFARRIDPGDRVEIRTRSGETLTLQVIEIDERGILGRPSPDHATAITVPFVEISSVSARQADGARTKILVVGGVLIAVALLGAALSSMGPGFPDAAY